MLNANSQDLRKLLQRDDYSFLFDLRVSQPTETIRPEDVDRIVAAIAKHYAILNVKAELDQLLCGMSTTIKVLELVRENPNAMRPLYVFNKVPITLDGLYDILPANYSPQGSNKREKEELVIIQWIHLTQYIEGMLFQLLLCNAKITLQ